MVASLFFGHFVLKFWTFRFGDYNNSNITYSHQDTLLIRQLYEDKVALLEKLLQKSEEEVKHLKALLQK